MNNSLNNTNEVILPPATLGVLGAGQLGMMFALAAKSMGYRVVVLDPDSNAPARLVADQHICKAYDDEEAWQILKQCAAVTTEFENVSVDLMQKLEVFLRVSPAARCVKVSQHRALEKETIRKAGLPTVPYRLIESINDCYHNDLSELFPGILKTASLGYDGKGQISVNELSELPKAFERLEQVPCVLEQKIDLQSDASVVVARLSRECIQCFPVADNVHVEGILFTSTVPSRLATELQETLKTAAIQLANYLDYVGVLAVEFFIDKNERVYVNEIAPRPHNSGHYTLDATLCSQFQQQVRILCGLPPSATTLYEACTMVNLLGDLWHDNAVPNWRILLQEPKVKLHLYSKKEARKGRKMGHFNVLAETPEKSLVKALDLFKCLESS